MKNCDDIIEFTVPVTCLWERWQTTESLSDYQNSPQPRTNRALHEHNTGHIYVTTTYWRILLY